MNHRQRIMSALRGQWPDRLPWAPRIDLWYEAHARMGDLPERYAGWSMYDILRDMGVALYNNRQEVFSTRLRGVEIVRQSHGYETRTEYRTPVGTVSTLLRSTPELERMGIQPYESEHMIKGLADYPVVEYIIEHTELVPEHDKIGALMREFGADGVVLACMGFSAPHKLLRELMGYELCFYEIADHPREFERLLVILEAQGREIQKIAADCPAEVIVVDENFTDTIPGPRLFRKYFLPYLASCSEYLHHRGKLTCSHVDGNMKSILGLFLDTGIDVAEAVTPAPMTNYTLAEARRTWGDRVAVWGGVPTTLLCPEITSEEEFEGFMHRLFEDIQPGNRFVLGLGDNLPTDGSLERLARITEMVEQHGSLLPQRSSDCRS
jgi:uroporphyrinogen-III decarboxylase